MRRFQVSFGLNLLWHAHCNSLVSSLLVRTETQRLCVSNERKHMGETPTRNDIIVALIESGSSPSTAAKIADGEELSVQGRPLPQRVKDAAARVGVPIRYKERKGITEQGPGRLMRDMFGRGNEGIGGVEPAVRACQYISTILVTRAKKGRTNLQILKEVTLLVTKVTKDEKEEIKT